MPKRPKHWRTLDELASVPPMISLINMPIMPNEPLPEWMRRRAELRVIEGGKKEAGDA
jgi:hypothetical protein